MAVSISSTVNTKPVFVLRQVNAVELIKRYNEGAFSQVKDLPSAKIEVAKSTAIMAPTHGKSLQEPTCAIKDRMDKSIIMYTDNVSNFETFTKSGGVPPKGGRCEWCRRLFTNESQGVPIAFKEGEAISANKNGAPYYAFWDEGTFCSYRCVLAHILMFKEIGPQQRDPLYLNSEATLRFRFSLEYPNVEVLLPAPDYRLLKENGGSLTDEEFDGTKYTYLRTANVVIIPCKVAYIRQPN